MSDVNQTPVKIVYKADATRSDLRRGLVWFVNYSAANPEGVSVEQLDLHGAAMLPEDVELLAHRWLSFSRSVDIEHDGVGRPVDVVESFYNSPDVASPAWPVNAHVIRLDVARCSEAMEGLRSGHLNCVSFDAFTFNVKRRMPAAQVQATRRAWVDEADLREQVIAMFPGVTTLRRAPGGVYVAERGGMTPVAIMQSSDGRLEASTATGPWATLTSALIATLPTLERGGDTVAEVQARLSSLHLIPVERRDAEREALVARLTALGGTP